VASEAVLRIKVITDTVAAAAGLDKVDASAGRMRQGLAKAAVPAAAAATAVIAFGKSAYDAASRAEQAMGGVDAVFGKSADKIKTWGKTAADTAGLASSEYAELTTVLGAQLKNMGVPMDQLAKKSDGLVRMGADMSATFGGTAKEAVEALSSALRGETDPIERYGVSVKQADIAARMAADGTDKLEGSAAKQAKTAALLALVTEQTADTQGAFAREADTAAGQSQRTAAKMEDMQAALGTALLPAMTAVVEQLGKLFKWMQENQTVTQILVGVIGALAAAIVVANVALAITAALASGPALIVVAVVALIAAFVLAYRKVDWFRSAVDVVFDHVKGIVMGVARFLVTAWEQAVATVRAVIRGVSNAWDAVSSAVRGAVSSLVGWVKSTWSSAVDAVSSAVQRVRDAWSTVSGAVRDLISGVANFLRSAIGGAIDTVSGAIRGWRDVAAGVFGAVSNAMSRVWAVFRDLGGKIKGMLSGASGWLTSVGTDIVRGLVDGINSVIGWVQNAVEALADKIPQWVKNKLGIASPSKVMAAIGMEIIAGLGLGMEAMSAEVEATSKAVADRVTASITRSFQQAAMAELPKKATDQQRERALAQAAEKAAKLSARVLRSLRDEYAAIEANNVAREANAEALKTQSGILDQLIGQQKSYADSVAQTASSFGALTTATVKEGEAFNAADMIANMAARVQAVKDFNSTLYDLRAMGLSEATLADLTAAGVETGGAMAAALAAGGPAAVAEVNAMQTQLDAAATMLGGSAAGGMYGAGVAAQQALVAGLQVDQATLDLQAHTLAGNLSTAVNTALRNADVKDAAETFAKRLAREIRKALREELRDLPNGGGSGGGGGNNRAVVASSVAPVVPMTRGAKAAPVVAGPTVIVNGAIDPEATARQIRRILAGHDRRVGLVS
jgi:hypothetical protein